MYKKEFSVNFLGHVEDKPAYIFFIKFYYSI